MQLVPDPNRSDCPDLTDIDPALSRRNSDLTITAEPCAEADDIDRIAARYLLRKLGIEAPGYVQRVIRRLVETGQSDKAAAWSAIASAVVAAADQPRPADGLQPGWTVR
jgi:hypothetical protein